MVDIEGSASKAIAAKSGNKSAMLDRTWQLAMRTQKAKIIWLERMLVTMVVFVYRLKLLLFRKHSSLFCVNVASPWSQTSRVVFNVFPRGFDGSLLKWKTTNAILVVLADVPREIIYIHDRCGMGGRLRCSLISGGFCLRFVPSLYITLFIFLLCYLINQIFFKSSRACLTRLLILHFIHINGSFNGKGT